MLESEVVNFLVLTFIFFIMKQLFILLLVLCSATASAQDVIVKKDGSTIVCRIVELNASEIVYKKWSDQKGANYVMNRSDASAINYENGKKVNLSETTENLYAPGNQNNGDQQMNDNALLKMYYNTSNASIPKVKKLRLIGWIGGGVLVAAGILFATSTGEHDPWLGDNEAARILFPACIGAGVIWTTSFLLAANHEKKKYINGLTTAPIIQQDFNIGKSSTLSAGVDMLRDKQFNTNTLGLGLRLHF